MIVPMAVEVDIISTPSVAQMTSHVAPSGVRVMRTSTPLIILRLASKQFRTDITLIWSKCAAHHNQKLRQKAETKPTLFLIILQADTQDLVLHFPQQTYRWALILCFG